MRLNENSYKYLLQLNLDRSRGVLPLENMVEAAGIEPPAENPLSEGATCLVSVFNLIW